MGSAAKEYFSRLDRLFHQALDTPAGEPREAFLEISCGGDRATLRDIRVLLERDSAVRGAAHSAGMPLPRFGVYRARELIGRGGMGAVYLADREDGEVSFQVAVKVISSPLWSSILEERFRRERQILAQMRHPGIASFIDGGVTQEGLPFLAMEYVKGEPIDRYCDSRRLPPRHRLDLFLRVCDAVRFAHQQLVVHRDIKPGNVLVSESGEPKLLDFGLARTMESAVEPGNNPTLFLTPVYSSPQVLRGRPAAVTDDVYSLGVLLYELLAGERPFGGHGLAPAEIIEAVLSSEPRAPSTIVGTTADSVTAARAETPASLVRILKGDLDAICLKAVAKSAADRYSSVQELAEDVRSYLAGRAVAASAGGSLYRVRKFVLRHKTSAIAAMAVVLSLAGGLTSTWAEAREARRQRAASERRFQEARALAHYMMFELQTSIQKLPGATPVKADMVQHSLDYLDRIALERSNDDALRVDIAEGYSELADVLGHPLQPNLGEAAKARDIYAKAIDMLQPVVARDPGNPRTQRTLARAQLMLGMSLVFYHEWERGRKLVETSAGELTRLAQGWPRDFDILKQSAAAYEGVAITISQRDGYTTGGDTTAIAALRQSIGYADAALLLKPGEAETVSQLASGYNRLALLTQTNDRPAAAGYFERALATLDSLPPSERSAASIRNRRAAILLAAGWNLGSAGQFDRGIADINEARTTIETLAAEDPQDRIYPQARASIYRNLGVIEDYAGHTTKALDAYLTAISIFEKMLAGNPANPYYRTTMADLEANAALLTSKLGHRSEGLRLARAAIPVLEQTALKPDASASELNLAARFLTQTEFPETCDAKLGLQLAERANAAAAGKDYVILETLGQAYWINRDRDGAVGSIERALSLIETPKPGEMPSRVRRVFQVTLAGYRSDDLPETCSAH